MTIAVGDRMPSGTLRTMTPEGVAEVRTDELFAGRKLVLFAVPGAFTPTCSDTHLPGFVVREPEILAAGVDEIACLAVNDAFVMEAWRSARGAEGLLMLADGNGDYTAALGLELDASRFGMGVRSRRFAAVVDDGIVEWLGVEPGAGVVASSAEAILAAL